MKYNQRKVYLILGNMCVNVRWQRGSCEQMLEFIACRESCYVVAAGNLPTDFRFWRGAGKLAVNGSPLRGVPMSNGEGSLKTLPR